MLKKILSAILTIAMILSLIPAVFANDAAEPAANANVKIVYDIYSSSTSSSIDYYADITSKLNGKILTTEFTDYTKSNGFWRFADLLKVPTSVSGHNTYNSSHQLHGGGWLFYTYPQNWYALGFHVPKAGTYKLVLTSKNRTNGGKFAYTVLSGGTSSDTITSELANVSWDAVNSKLIDTAGNAIGVMDCSVAASSPDHEVTFPEAGEYLLVFKNVGATSGKNDLSIDKFTLTNGNGTVSVPMGYTILADQDNTLGEGEETTATISALYGSGDWMKKTYSADQVEYTSSNTDVATVSADGTVTAKKEGTAEITAVVDGATLVSAPLTVTGSNIKVVYDIYELGAQNSTDYYNEVSSNIAEQTLISAFSDYTKSNGFWKRALPLVGSGHKVQYGRWLFNTSLDNWYALNFHVPKAGTYKLVLTSKNSTAGGKFAYTVLPGGASSDTITSQLANVSWDAVNSKLVDTDGDALGVMDCTVSAASPEHKVSFPEAGEYLLVFKNIYHGTSGYLYIEKFTLTNGDGTVSAPMGYTIISDADKTIAVGETTTATISSLYGSGDWMKKTYTADKITYTSSNIDVATVSADGTVTAKKAGTTEIAAVVDGYQLVSAPVTVEKYEEAPDDLTLWVASNDTDKIPNSNITVTVDGAPVAVGTIASVENGASVSLSAAEVEGYRFKAWMGSAGAISLEPEYSFNIYTNTPIRAVYEELPAENEVQLSFWKSNFEKIEVKNVTKGARFGDKKLSDPTIKGFENFLGWFKGLDENEEPIKVNDEEAIDQDTDVVALFGNPVSFSGVTVDGEAKTADYDSAIEATSNSESFSYWKRGENIVSYNKNYTFYAWKNNFAITSVNNGAVSADAVALLEADGSDWVFEYEIPADCTRLEAGIIFGNSNDITIKSCLAKAVSKRGSAEMHGQFTASSDYTCAKGYIIFGDADGKICVVYSK